MIKLKSILLEGILDKNAILYLGWIKRDSLKVIGMDITSGEDETHHNYLMSMPPEWKEDYDRNLIRWRYRKDMNVIFWWDFSRPTENEKTEVEKWVYTNLKKSDPDHRIILTNRDNINFLKSHGEDE